ncbi:MAG: tripartite tricarboxylate transporter TctB family protein [Oscillospiraceae bacterium]|nr:tripartite tricarboxylate transporter TctB family protein [Oscillospiraceae bacterium]
MAIKLLKRLVTPTLMMGWAIYYFIEICGKKASAGYFIKPIFWVMALLYCLIVFMDARDCRDEAEAEKTADSPEQRQAGEEKAAAQRADLKRTAICIGSAFAYIFILPYLGFILSTTLVLFGLFWWLGSGNKLLTFVYAAGVALGMYLLFKTGLKVPLLTGFLGFI